MDVSVTPVADTQYRCTDKNVVKLQTVFSTSFALWEKTADAWENRSAPEVFSGHDAQLLAQAIDEKKPITQEIEPGKHWLAVPLPNGDIQNIKRVALAAIETIAPDFLCPLAEEILHSLRHQEQIDQLCQENDIFLHQVSEDFEELAFLRSMAERLVLGDCSKNLAHLVQHTLPLLGAAAGVKGIYFLTRKDRDNASVNQEWHCDEGANSLVSHRDLEIIIKLFGEVANSMPVVKNHLQTGQYATQLPGIGEFILVGLSSISGQHGWLLAVNRNNLSQEKMHEPICRLSQNELGTNEASLINTAAAMLASHAHNLALLEARESQMLSMVRTLVSAIDSRDPYTCGHSERVARYGKRLAEALGFSADAREKIYLTGLLHDIGKIGVSDAVLNKTGTLTDEEFSEIKRHPDLGWEILRDLEQLEYMLPGVLHHHERFDGKGYPDGLTGTDTPLDGRLLAVVDAFDAMTSDRPYRQGMPLEKAVGILADGAGQQWDPQLVETFISILPDILSIKDNYQRPPIPRRVSGQLSNADGTFAVSATPA
ncbi:MAG: HD-GYP domain-containing protein [Pirellulales bacterium]|nr:HD-GYP domain-containing protein [Pirellulales bacterium]